MGSVATINSKSVTNQPKTNVEILNVPSRPNIRISSSFAPKRRESVEIIQSVTSTQLTSRDQIQLSSRGPQQTPVSIQQSVSMDDIPKNLLSLGQESSNVSVSSGSQIISIGGENFLLPQEPEPAQKLVLSQEQAQQLLRAQEQGQQQIIIEQQHPQQLVFNQEHQQLQLDPNQQLQFDPNQQLQVDPNQQLQIDPNQHLQIDPNQQLQLDPNQQHIFVDEHGQQVVLTPDQQLQFLQQYNDSQPLQFDQGEILGADVAQLNEAGQDQLVQLEGENGERVMLAFPDANQLLFQDDSMNI